VSANAYQRGQRLRRIRMVREYLAVLDEQTRALTENEIVGDLNHLAITLDDVAQRRDRRSPQRR